MKLLSAEIKEHYLLATEGEWKTKKFGADLASILTPDGFAVATFSRWMPGNLPGSDAENDANIALVALLLNNMPKILEALEFYESRST